MKCPKCGKEIADGMKFCPECGTMLENASGEAPKPESPENSQKAPEANPSDKTEKGKPKGRLIAALCAAAAVVVVIAVLVLTHKPTVNMADFVSVSFDGYNTVGTASESFDTDAFRKKYTGKMKLNKKYLISCLTEYGGYDEEQITEDVESTMSRYEDSGEDLCVEFFCNFVANIGSLDKYSGLSNGDVITYSWNDLDSEELTAQLGKAFGCKLKCEPAEFTVEGLEEIETIDPFADIEVSFEGVSPEGTVTITNNSADELVKDLHFVADKSSGLSNGDKITVAVNNYNGEERYYAEQYGKLLSVTEKEYTVEGLQHYITSIDEIPADTLEAMKKEADDNFEAYRAKNYSSTEMLKGREYIGSYVLSQKKENGYGNFHCAAYLCYRVDVENYYEDKSVLYDQVNTYYTLCRFDDIMVAEDGSVSVDLSDYSSPESDSYSYGTCDFGNGEFILNGYESLDSLYKNVIQKQADKYQIEDQVKDVETDYEPTYCSTIPDAAKEHNGHYYLCVNAGAISWEDAEKRCEEKKGHLVTITSEDEMAWILRNLEVATHDEYWIGCEMDQNGSWTWVTGEKFDYSNWADYNPRDTDGKMYYVTTSVDGKWVNAPNISGSWNLDGYVIEWDGPISDAATDSSSASTAADAAGDSSSGTTADAAE